MVLFEIENYRSRLWCRIILGPGPQDTRDKIHGIMEQHPDLFNRATSKVYPQYWSFHGESLVGTKRYEELSVPDLKAAVSKRLNALISEKVPKMVEALSTLREVT